MEVRDITGRNSRRRSRISRGVIYESRCRPGISRGVRVDGGQGYHGARE